MKRLARAFSALVLAALTGAVLLPLWLGLQRPPPALPPLAGPVERIVVEKAARRMQVWSGGQVVRVYEVALGFAPRGDKERQGDGRTPEGLFRIDRRNSGSAYHLSLGLDYPQADDIARAGGYDPGGDIMIHGQPNALAAGLKLRGDWTAGCVALTNAQIDELFAATPIGTPVEIRP